MLIRDCLGAKYEFHASARQAQRQLVVLEPVAVERGVESADLEKVGPPNGEVSRVRLRESDAPWARGERR